MISAETAVLDQDTEAEQLAPARLHRLITSYIDSKAIFLAVETGLFEALQQQPDTSEGLASRLGLEERPTRILLTALRGSRLVDRAEGIYHNTKWASSFLVASSPQYMGEFVKHQSVHFNNFARLGEALRSNTSITGRVQKDGYSNQGAGAAEQRDGTRRFVQALHGSALLQAESLARKASIAPGTHLADLGCGSGAYSIVLAQHNPELTITAMDYPAVCEVAQEYVDAAGLGGQVSFAPGDIFSGALPDGCNAALLSHVLDGYGRARAQALIERIAAWLPPGGQLYLHAHVPSRAKVPFPFGFGLILLANTAEGEVHDEDSILQWLAGAGFQDIQMTEVSPLSCLFTCHI